MIDFIKDNFIWIAGLVTAGKWTYEYSQKLRWERSKFLFDRLEAFLAKESTKKVHVLLDWNSVMVDIDGKDVHIDDSILQEALKTHDQKRQFTELELQIRGLFDEYFDGLTEFLILSECGLLSKADFRKFMDYWIRILNGNSQRKPAELHRHIDDYIRFYGFDRLHSFVHSSGLSWLERFMRNKKS